jgi:hypothetical protein
MKKVIFEFWDSNMAQQEWRWVFSLERCADGTFTLSGEQMLVGSEESDEPLQIAPASGLRLGADIYDRFQMMLAAVGENILQEDIDAIADEIAELDPKVADYFRRAEDLLLHRAQRSRRRERAEKEAIQMRFADAISCRTPSPLPYIQPRLLTSSIAAQLLLGLIVDNGPNTWAISKSRYRYVSATSPS